MMMRMLESGGMPVLTDGVRRPDTDNPRGYYEFEPVKRLDRDASWLPEAYNKAIKVIYIFLYHLPSRYRYRVLFLRRSMDEVIASQKLMLRRRSEADRLGDEQLAASFKYQLQNLYDWIRHQNNIKCLYLDYGNVITAPEAAVREIIDFLGLPLDAESMIHAVEPALHRHRSSGS